MGKEATLKTLRRQLRGVVQEEIEKVLKAELVVNIRKELGAQVDTGIKTLNDVLNHRIDTIESRNKDIQNYIIRESNKGAATQEIPLVSMEPDSE